MIRLGQHVRTVPHGQSALPGGDGFLRGVGLLAAFTLALIFVAEMATPREESFATLAAVPIAIGAWLTERAWRWLLFLAIALAATAAALGGMSAVTTAAVVAGCTGTVAVLRLARSNSQPIAVAQPPAAGRELALEELGPGRGGSHTPRARGRRPRRAGPDRARDRGAPLHRRADRRNAPCQLLRQAGGGVEARADQARQRLTTPPRSIPRCDFRGG